jgi:hypothetical protein
MLPRMSPVSRVAACLLVAAGCSATPGTDAPAPPATEVASTSAPPAASAGPRDAIAKEAPGELDVDPASFDFSKNPELTDRIAESPHAYFRFIGHAFARAVCKRFEAKAAAMPRVRLHGDPHVEQYAVTDLGRGLADYDDASIGPAAIDLVRMGTSIVLAARVRAFSDADRDRAIDELFRGYAEGLQGKGLAPAAPPLASSLLAKFSKDRKGFLDATEKSLVPIDAEEDRFARARLDEYLASVKGKEPKRSPGFYSVKRVGRLKLGLGSALVRKYLVRLEGPTASQEDDVIMEIKEVSDLSNVPCVEQLPGGAVEHRADEQRKSGADKKLLLPALLPDQRFWVNEWLSNYQEAKVKKLEAQDLSSIAYEMGVELGQEHTKAIPGASTPKPEALAPTEPLSSEMRTAMRELADASTRGWERFNRDVAKKAKAP